MDVATDAPMGGDVTTIPTSGGNSELSIAEAARSIADFRYKREAEASRQAEQPAESAPPATAEQESAQADAAPEGTTAEDQGTEPELPAIEPPRSWSKDAHERWSKLDRETQEFLAARDSEDQKAIKRSLNEAAEQRKAFEAQRSEAEKVRQQYEAKLPALMQDLESAYNAQFSDIKSMADVEKLASEAARLATEDPFRALQIQTYLNAWNVHQQKMAVVRQEMETAKQRQSEEKSKSWIDHVQQENAKAAELIPDLADKVKGPALMNRATERLAELGFGTDELQKLASGEEKLSIYDHRIQQLIFSDLKLSDIQKSAQTIKAKPLPPAQRPGAGKVSSGPQAQIQELSKQLESASGLRAIRLAAEITRLQRAG